MRDVEVVFKVQGGGAVEWQLLGVCNPQGMFRPLGLESDITFFRTVFITTQITGEFHILFVLATEAILGTPQYTPSRVSIKGFHYTSKCC